LANNLRCAFLRNGQSEPAEFPAATFWTGTISGGFNRNNRIGAPQWRRNKVTAREYQQYKNSYRPENDPPFHTDILKQKKLIATKIQA
jgi:hypothetical protein